MSKFTKLIAEIGDLKLVELNEFLEEFQTTFNVSAAAPAVVSGGQALQEAPVAEKLEFTVTVKDIGPNKLEFMKEFRKVKPGVGLIEAKQVAESVPAIIGEKVPKEDAKKWKEALEKVGAKVELS